MAEVKVPKNILNNIRQLVDYVYEDEKSNYEEIKDEMEDSIAHVFHVIENIDKFLTEHGID